MRQGGVWARPGSGFTLLFEVAMLTYAKQIPIAPLAQLARAHDTRIWRVIGHHVNTARAGMDFSHVQVINHGLSRRLNRRAGRRRRDDRNEHDCRL